MGLKRVPSGPAKPLIHPIPKAEYTGVVEDGYAKQLAIRTKPIPVDDSAVKATPKPA